MRHPPIRTIILLAWLAMSGWFVRYEAFPGWFTGAVQGYRGLLREGEIFIDSWMQIRFQEKAIGYSHLQVEMDEKHPAEQYHVTSRTMLDLNLGGEMQHVSVLSISRLDPFQRLVSFEFSLNARRYAMTIQGRRKEGDTFLVTVRSGASRTVSTVRIPDDVVLYSPMTMMAMGRMKPGETQKLKTLDPASMEVAHVLVKALRREKYGEATNQVDATVLAVSYQGMDMLTWVDGAGQVLRQDTPFGWSMIATTPEIAMKSDTGGEAAADLMKAMGVSVSGEIRDVETCRRLQVRLSGIRFPLDEVAGERLQVDSASNATAVVTLRANVLEREQPLAPDVRTAALASTAYIQSDAPELIEQARAVTAGLGHDEERAQALSRWVHKSVRKNLTASIPSALDVLRQREGDCNEHTYLCVALARAIGIPAQVRVGIVYKDGAYFYHAWPAFFVGRWKETDPTLGEEQLGVRHLTLLQGEIGSQVKLMSALGQLRVEVLAQDY